MRGDPRPSSPGRASGPCDGAPKRHVTTHEFVFAAIQPETNFSDFLKYQLDMVEVLFECIAITPHPNVRS